MGLKIPNIKRNAGPNKISLKGLNVQNQKIVATKVEKEKLTRVKTNLRKTGRGDY